MNFAFNNVHDFIAMGQHGVYVWSAWFITLASIVYLILQSHYARQRFFKEELTKVQLQKVRTERFKRESSQ